MNHLLPGGGAMRWTPDLPTSPWTWLNGPDADAASPPPPHPPAPNLTTAIRSFEALARACSAALTAPAHTAVPALRSVGKLRGGSATPDA